MIGGQTQYKMFKKIRLGCEGVYNFYINHAPYLWPDLRPDLRPDIDDRLLDVVHEIENNLTRNINKLKREQNVR